MIMLFLLLLLLLFSYSSPQLLPQVICSSRLCLLLRWRQWWQELPLLLPCSSLLQLPHHIPGIDAHHRGSIRALHLHRQLLCMMQLLLLLSLLPW